MVSIPPRAKLEVVYRDKLVSVARFGNVIIAATGSPHDTSRPGNASHPDLEASRALHLRLRDEYPEGFAKLIITPGGSRMLGNEEREHVNRLTREFAHSTLAIALVLEGQGVWFSSMRVVVKAMMLALPSQFPQQTFARVSEAAAWLFRQCGSAAAFDAPGLVAAAEAARPHSGQVVEQRLGT